MLAMSDELVELMSGELGLVDGVIVTVVLDELDGLELPQPTRAALQTVVRIRALRSGCMGRIFSPSGVTRKTCSEIRQVTEVRSISTPEEPHTASSTTHSHNG
jgi:hypothetical protein